MLVRRTLLSLILLAPLTGFFASQAPAQIATLGVTIGGPGGAGLSGGGGSNNPVTRRACILVGGDKEVCFYLDPPRLQRRYFNGTCCFRRVVKKRVRIKGRIRTVYVDEGRRCFTVSSPRQCRPAKKRRSR